MHSFKTLGAAATDGSFCVINDTHDRKLCLDRVLTKIEELKPSVVIWNPRGQALRKVFRQG